MHICYAFIKLNASGEGETMRLDFIIIALGILLAVAMVLTLLYGKEYSRHGYGQVIPVSDDASCETAGPCCRFTLREVYGAPCSIG